MYPTETTPNYAAIERHAHELRREAVAELSAQVSAWMAAKVAVLQDIAAAVRGRMLRNREQAFFEAE